MKSKYGELQGYYAPVTNRRSNKQILWGGLIFLVCVIIPTALLAGSANQKTDYELQERCGLTSSQWAKEHKEVINYEAKYNKKKNACMVYATLAPIKTDNIYTSYYMVYDPNSNKTFAQYTVRSGSNYEERICIIGGKRTDGVTLDKWNMIVKELMEQ